MRLAQWTATAAKVLGLGAAICGTMILPLLVMTPRTAIVAAAFPPWWASSDIIRAAAAAGEPLRLGRFSWIVIVHGDSATLGARLRAAGALVLLDPRSLAGCSG